jgi:hypothetical protein
MDPQQTSLRGPRSAARCIVCGRGGSSMARRPHGSAPLLPSVGTTAIRRCAASWKITCDRTTRPMGRVRATWSTRCAPFAASWRSRRSRASSERRSGTVETRTRRPALLEVSPGPATALAASPSAGSERCADASSRNRLSRRSCPVASERPTFQGATGAGIDHDPRRLFVRAGPRGSVRRWV